VKMKLTSYLIERVLFESSRTTDFFDLYACEAMKDTLEEARGLFRVLFEEFREILVRVGAAVIRNHTAVITNFMDSEVFRSGDAEEIRDFLMTVQEAYGISRSDDDFGKALHHLDELDDMLSGNVIASAGDEERCRSLIRKLTRIAALECLETRSISDMKRVYKHGEKLFDILGGGSPANTWIKIIDTYLRMRDRKSFEAFDRFLDLSHNHGELRDYLENVGRNLGYDMKWISRKNLDIRARGSLRDLARYCSSYVGGLIRDFRGMSGRRVA